jgi:hypothetical protein
MVLTPKREVSHTGLSFRIKSTLKMHPIMVQKHVDFVETSNHNQPGIHNIESSEQDLTLPDLRNVLITHTATLNGISAMALIHLGAQADFVDTNFVLARAAANTFLKESSVCKYAYNTYSYANTCIYMARKKKKKEGTLG